MRMSAVFIQTTTRMENSLSPEATDVPCDSLGHQEQIPIFDYPQTYEEDNLKSFEVETDVPCLTPISQYNQCAPIHFCSHQPDYLLESSSSCRSLRPNFCQLEQMTSSVSLCDIFSGIPTDSSITSQTVTPAQAFPFAAIATLPFSCFETPPTIATRTQYSPIPTHSLGNPFGPDTPSSPLCEEQTKHGMKFNLFSADDSEISPGQQHRRVFDEQSRMHLAGSNLSQKPLHSVIKVAQFKCKAHWCNRSFKRQEHLKRHMKSHSEEKQYVCWVPGCYRAFLRCDNLNAHYTNTHSKPGGRNRYVATLDKTSPDYNPEYRGKLTSEGRPLYASRLEKSSIANNTT